MNILISQHLSDLPIAQWCFMLTHLSRDLRVRALLCQELLSCHALDCNRIIGSIKHLESQPTLLDCQVTDLSQVPGVNVTPCISLTRSRVGEIGWEVLGILMRLNDISDSESVDVVLEASGEGASCLLTTNLRECVSGSL
jgi:hypothetical protein